MIEPNEVPIMWLMMGANVMHYGSRIQPSPNPNGGVRPMWDSGTGDRISDEHPLTHMYVSDYQCIGNV